VPGRPGDPDARSGSLASIAEFAVSVRAHTQDRSTVQQRRGDGGTRRQDRGRLRDPVRTNHLGHFALTMQLMPSLLEASAARVVSTTSLYRFTAGSTTWRTAYARLLQAVGRLRDVEACGPPVRPGAESPSDGSDGDRLRCRSGFSRTNLQVTSARALNGWQQRFWSSPLRS